ncbi:hypothetical protein D3C76_1318050 [compost metagenome]
MYPWGNRAVISSQVTLEISSRSIIRSLKSMERSARGGSDFHAFLQRVEIHGHKEGPGKIAGLLAFISNVVLSQIAVQIHDAKTDRVHFLVCFGYAWGIGNTGHIANSGQGNHALMYGFTDFAMFHHVNNVQGSQIAAYIAADCTLLSVVGNL